MEIIVTAVIWGHYNRIFVRRKSRRLGRLCLVSHDDDDDNNDDINRSWISFRFSFFTQIHTSHKSIFGIVTTLHKFLTCARVDLCH